MKRRNLIYTSLFIVLILISASILLFNKQRFLTLKLKQESTEHRLLRSQMNPHFIFNTLGAIQSFIIQGKNKSAISYLVKFSNLVRQILENSRENNITFSQELATLENYLYLQKMRFGD